MKPWRVSRKDVLGLKFCCPDCGQKVECPTCGKMMQVPDLKNAPGDFPVKRPPRMQRKEP